MAYSNKVQAITLPAHADYSSTGQFRFVDVNSSERAQTVSTAGGNAIGVLLNGPSAQDREAEVGIGGVVKVVASAAISAGARVSSTNDGRAVTAATGNHVLGRAMEAASAAGQIISVLLLKDGISA